MPEMPDVTERTDLVDYVTAHSVGNLALNAAKWPMMLGKWRNLGKRSFSRTRMTKHRPGPPLAWESHHVTLVTVSPCHIF